MPARLLLTLLLLSATSVAVAHHPGHGHDHAEAVILSEATWDDHVPQGKEVDAIYGDAVLVNRYLTAVIADPLATRNANMTVRNVGGCLIDLTVNSHSSDQLSAYYPGRRKYAFRQRALSSSHSEVSENGRVTSQSEAEVIVTAPGDAETPQVTVTYRLTGEDRFLMVETKYANVGKEPLTVTLEDDLRADGGKEDMQKAPNGERTLFWFHDRYWGQAYGIEAIDRQVVSLSDSRTAALKFRADGEESITLPPGESFTLTRRIIPGRDLLEVKAVADQLHGTDVHPVAFRLQDGSGKPIAGALVDLLQGDAVRGSGRTDEHGVLTTALPTGDYQLAANALGVDITAKSPIAVQVADQDDVQTFDLNLANWQPGRVAVKVTDAEGRPIACKIEFTPHEGTPKPYFGPETAEYGVFNLQYAPHGECVVPLPAGTYSVTVSHGPEYDALTAELTIEAGGDEQLTGKLPRTVETPGWVSSDFHSHSSPSGDNTGSQLGRVLNLVAEHIEFAPCTEHNRIETYEPEIAHLGIGHAIATVSGMELTGSPLPLNHQNVFPLIYKPRTQDGGGPVTDVDPERQIERIYLWDDRSEKLIQQNHPDIGWLFFDRDGNGEPDEGFERSHGLIDVMEIHPVYTVLSMEPVIERSGGRFPNRILHWLQLLNQGYRIPGVVNTDAHYNFHGSGGLRNWIQSSTDDPARIDTMEMVRAAEQGRLIMSNGPYLEFSVRETDGETSVVSGQDLEARSGKVTVTVRVQCPNWLDVDRVFLLVNGRVHKVHNYRRITHADKFGDGVVKFEADLPLELERDAHIIAVAGGENHEVGDVMGPMWGDRPTAAMSNPVFVDVDGGGFKPNKDTLDHPLPVRFKTN